MTIDVRSETARKLDHIPERLMDEFPGVPEEPVKREVRFVADQLVAAREVRGLSSRQDLEPVQFVERLARSRRTAAVAQRIVCSRRRLSR